MQSVKTWDVVIVGGGIIGLTLAIELRKRGAGVLVVERGSPGREASHAAAGMLSDCGPEMPAELHVLARASAAMYPEFVHELQDESGINVDLRDQGTVILGELDLDGEEIAPSRLADLGLSVSQAGPAFYLKERSVDPRALMAAALKAAKHRDVNISSGTVATGLLLADGRVAGLATDKTAYHARVVVNCAGAWAGQISAHRFPVRPVKGQMLCVAGGKPLKYVLRAPDVYLVPRSDGRILIGSTLEDAGYDKRVDANTIQKLHRSAISLVPALEQARVLEDWAGLRPGTPDDLPILGATDTPGYFAATGHFRDGILLSPVTAKVMTQVISGGKSDFDLAAFSPARFRA